MEQEKRAFRDCLGCFATGITVVTTKTSEDVMCGVTVNSFNTVSLEPKLILFSLGLDSFSTDLFVNSSHFVVNILAAEQEGISRHFAGHLLSLEDCQTKWNDMDYCHSERGIPVLNHTLATLECSKEVVYEGGDHAIFVGHVESFEIHPEKQPLLYYQGQYKQLA